MIKPVLKNGKFDEVDEKDIQYQFESPDQFYDSSVNLIPLQNAVTAMRLFYGIKFLDQALTLKDGDEPYVQSLKDPNTNESYDEYLGKKIGSVILNPSKDDDPSSDYTITSVSPDVIKYKNNKTGKEYSKDLYNNFAFNRKTSITNIPLVKKGDVVKPNQVLARSNYTSKNGTLAMGKNARVGIVPYKGWTMDDAIVISQSFANKLTSHQTYQYNEDEADENKLGKDHFISLFPQKYTKDQLVNIQDNGIIKPGSVVQKGYPLILSTKPRIISSNDNYLGKLSKYLKNTRNDSSIIWDHDTPGTVTDVVKGRNGYKVVVETWAPAKAGDKLASGRSGNKNTISRIIPDELMPRTKDGRPLDALFNPLGLVSRVNPSYIYEALLGKVAEKTGKPYKLPTYNKANENWYDFVKGELDKNGLTDTEEVYDPETDKYLEKPITVGNIYMLKLHHTGESKLSARAQGIYDSQQQPVKGGEEGMQCFPKGTLIHTYYGKIDIKDICEQHLRIPVLTYDFKNKVWCYKNITDWFIREANIDELISVSIKDTSKKHIHTKLNITKNHLIYNKDGTKSFIGSLKKNDIVYSSKKLFEDKNININTIKDLTPLSIETISPFKPYKSDIKTIFVYDFTVEDTHAYIANNILVSNSKRLSGLELFGLLSAGAYNVIRDGLNVRGEKNDEYWRALRLGQTPSLNKKSPFVWNKFLALLQGAGIKAQEKGDSLRAAPFTDKDLDTYNPIELKNAEIINLRTLQPVPDGLFDPSLSIAHKWSKITLSEPMINPPFEGIVSSLLGIKQKDLYDIIAGKKDLENYGTTTTAIQKALKDIDIKSMFNQAYKEFKEGPKSGKQKALNRMNYIKGLVRNNITPDQLIITKIPVIPPAFRPYSMIGETFIPGDINELYKEVFNTNQAHKELKEELGQDSDDVKENNLDLYKSIRALYGLDEPASRKLKQRGVSGFMQKLVGGTAKFSFLQRAINSKPVDFSARSVIGVNPELNMDEIGIPYDIAWKIFSPYVQRELSKRGMSLSDSLKEIANRTDKAKDALLQVTKERPVWYSRAPAWHKFNTLGGWAKLHDGKNILINPLVTTGMGADFDGDCQNGFIFLALPKDLS